MAARYGRDVVMKLCQLAIIDCQRLKDTFDADPPRPQKHTCLRWVAFSERSINEDHGPRGRTNTGHHEANGRYRRQGMCTVEGAFLSGGALGVWAAIFKCSYLSQRHDTCDYTDAKTKTTHAKGNCC